MAGSVSGVCDSHTFFRISSPWACPWTTVCFAHLFSGFFTVTSSPQQPLLWQVSAPTYPDPAASQSAAHLLKRQPGRPRKEKLRPSNVR